MNSKYPIYSEIERIDNLLSSSYARLTALNNEIEEFNNKILGCDRDLEAIKRSEVLNKYQVTNNNKYEPMITNYKNMCIKYKQQKEDQKKMIMAELVGLVSSMIDLKEKEEKLATYPDVGLGDSMMETYSDSDFYNDVGEDVISESESESEIE